MIIYIYSIYRNCAAFCNIEARGGENPELDREHTYTSRTQPKKHASFLKIQRKIKTPDDQLFSIFIHPFCYMNFRNEGNQSGLKIYGKLYCNRYLCLIITR